MYDSRCFDKSLILRDGVKLTSRIWLPHDSGPWPALLMRQPYGREIASTITYSHPRWWASKGYMVIIQDVRGTGSSEGVFNAFSQEACDTSETHEWIRSLKECNGKLGLYGFSYQGFTQLIGESNSQPPDCLSPAMTGLNIKDHWCSDGGAYWWHNNIAWGLQITALKMKRENNFTAWEKIRLSLENKSYLREGLDILRKYDPNSFVLEWHKNLTNGNPFDEIKPISKWIKKPMFIIGGLWDPHLKGALDLYKKSKDAGGSPEILIGNATHLNWWEGSQESLLKFFDKHLKLNNSKSKDSQTEKKIWNISLNKWDELDDKFYPEFIFGLKSNGVANLDIEDGSLIINSKGSGWFTIVSDPWRPTPSDGGHLGPNPGKFNRNIIDKRLDVGVFQTNSFKEDQNLKGVPTLKLLVKSDQPSFDICLALSLVEEDDEKANQFSTGFLRVKNSKINEECIYQIKMQPTNICLIKGSKLRLSISAAAYPAIGVNPGFEEGNIGAPSANHRVITLSFSLDKTFMKMTPFFYK